jgi:DNA-binding NarL/FixJ family response regulator
LVEALSARELAVLRLLAEGTGKNYVTTVLQKITARDRTQAVLRGRELGRI